MQLILLLLPALALASIEVKMGGKIIFESKHIMGNIRTNGFEHQAVTENYQMAFQIQDQALKSAIETYYGKRPDQIFFTRDTPWGDLHKKHAANPVQVKIEPYTPINMYEISSKKVELTRSIYENEHTSTKKIRIVESDTKYDKISSLWINPNKLSDNTIRVHVALNFQVQNDTASADHTFNFGINSVALSKKPRSQSGSVNLAAGQKVLAQLEAKHGTLKFQIPYKVSLYGSLTLNYNDEYKGSHFHALDVNQVLGNRTIYIYQTLGFDFYYGQHLNIIDAKDGYTVLKSFVDESGTSTSQRRRVSAAEYAAVTGEKIPKKAAMMSAVFTDKDLESVVEEVLENQDNEESSESSEQKSAEGTENKTPLEVPKSG